VRPEGRKIIGTGFLEFFRRQTHGACVGRESRVGRERDLEWDGANLRSSAASSSVNGGPHTDLLYI
jgi:hypothetical protein